MTAPAARLAQCPKRMVFGPCGGVRVDGGCEVHGVTCPFVTMPLPEWRARATDPMPFGTATTEFLATMARRPVVVTDFPAPPCDADAARRIAAILAGRTDAVLLGDHGDARVQFPPSYRAVLCHREGVAVWAGVNCRDRNSVALEGELAALADADVAGVHCVTGDHTALGHRPDTLAVFDLDSTRLVATAAAAGLFTSVGETPLSPPVGHRPQRLAEKVHAGAMACFVNHSGGAPAVAEFISAAQEAGGDVPFIACVAVATSSAGADHLRAFTGLVLPDAYLDDIVAARDVRRAGIAASIRLAEQLLEVPGVRGVNLSGVPGTGDEDDTALALAEISDALR